MNITADEARILSAVLVDGKYDLTKYATKHSGVESMQALEELEIKLRTGSKDMRRNGRKSSNGFSDCLNRFVSKHKKTA
jgi:hypothetical protein